MEILLKKILVCALYCTTSAALSLINKNLFLNHNYNYPIMVTFNKIIFFQFLFFFGFICFLKFMKANKILEFLSLPEFSLQNLKKCWIFTFTYLANVLLGIYALSKVSIPVFLSIRRLATLFMFLFDTILLKKPFNDYEAIGVLFISAGAIVAGVIFI